MARSPGVASSIRRSTIVSSSAEFAPVERVVEREKERERERKKVVERERARKRERERVRERE